MGSALDIIARHTSFKKYDTRLITYTSGPAKTQIYCIMVRDKIVKELENQSYCWGGGCSATAAPDM